MSDPRWPDKDLMCQYCYEGSHARCVGSGCDCECGDTPGASEPSQEAVELARPLGHFNSPLSNGKPLCACGWDWPCEKIAPLDSALRAVEQRTRLETLERAAKLTCGPCARKLYDRVADGKAGSL